MKSKKIKKLRSILIVIDDHADDPKFIRYRKIITWIVYKRQARCSKCDLFNTKIQCFSAYHSFKCQFIIYF